MPILHGINRRLMRPWTNEARRFLAGRMHLTQTVTADRLGEFRFRVENRTELSRTLDYGQELLSLAAFLFLLKPDDVVWDVGASVGLFTVHSAARCSRLVAFEPDPMTFARLQENVALNGLTATVQCKACALGDKKDSLELATDGLDGFAPVFARADLGRHRATTIVPVETIDLLVQGGTPQPSVIKLDIEGAEMLALQGGRQVLSGPSRPRLLFIELHPRFLPNFGASSAETESLVMAYGYRLVSTHRRAEQYHLIALRAD